MIVALSVLVALACVFASARRLWFAANPTALHPDDVIAFLGRSHDKEALTRLREKVRDVPGADWERDLLEALDDPRPEARAALVNEQLTELDLRMQRWARVPRVCASIATSAGIMLGTLVLRNGLANAPDLTGDLGELFVRDVLSDAISVACFGIVGTAFCIAAHAHSRRMTRARLQAADRMVERLEALVGGATGSTTVTGTELSEEERRLGARAPHESDLETSESEPSASERGESRK